jgi:FMN reductase
MAGESEYLVISTSLRPESNSRALAEQIVKDYATLSVTADSLDLRDHPLPLCDGDAAYDHPEVEPLSRRIAGARVVIVAIPIYNYFGNAAFKNLVELTGQAWENKIVGFLCAAGGDASYMSVIGVANGLMLDFRSLIIPRFVYATGEDFDPGPAPRSDIRDRVRQLAEISTKVRYLG